MLSKIKLIIKIEDYENQVVLKNLPSNRNYSFMVLVYDKNMDRWSDHSEPSEPVEIANSNMTQLHEN